MDAKQGISVMTNLTGQAESKRVPQVLAEKARAQDLANELHSLAEGLREKLQSVLRIDPPVPDGKNKTLSAEPLFVELAAAFACIRETNKNTAGILRDILNRLEI